MRVQSINNYRNNYDNNKNQPAFGATISITKGAMEILAKFGKSFADEFDKLAPKIKEIDFDGLPAHVKIIEASKDKNSLLITALPKNIKVHLIDAP